MNKYYVSHDEVDKTYDVYLTQGDKPWLDWCMCAAPTEQDAHEIAGALQFYEDHKMKEKEQR